MTEQAAPAATPAPDQTFRRAKKPTPPPVEEPIQKDAATEAAPKEKAKRGRKNKYSSEEDRVDARRKQQRDYRQRKKQELVELRKLVKNTPKPEAPKEQV